jgi:serine/threonine-protein kinase RsbW
MAELAELKLSLPARSENLGKVRRAVSEYAASLGVEEETIADLRLAVNEACSNVVRHAYEGDEGLMEVEARPIGDCLLVTVQDRGRGLGGRSSDPGTGLGLRVASAVSGSFAMQQNAPGTEVRLVFPIGAAA